MEITTELSQWLSDNNINYQELGFGMIKIQGFGTMIEAVQRSQEYATTLNTEQKVMCLSLQPKHLHRICNDEVDYVIYSFGGKYYYTPSTHIMDAELNPLKYVGEYNDEQIPDFGRGFLGVHGRYEMMNGTRDYKDWCKKAKFLKYSALGICEHHTLAGTLSFQSACKKAGLQSILGYSATIQDDNQHLFQVKLYAINDKGWRNLLQLNAIINVQEQEFILLDQLLKHNEGLVCVLTPNNHTDKQLVNLLVNSFEKAFYQFTTNEFLSPTTDKELLNNIKRYLDNFMSDIQPILISDAYCLDKNDTHIKKVLNKQGNVQFSNTTVNHYFRSIDEMFEEIAPLFNEDDYRLEDVFIAGLESIDWMLDNCKFNIDTKSLFLPKYEMTPQEIEKYGDTQTMFDDLIWEGLNDKFSEDLFSHFGDQFKDELVERIDKEKDVITRGGFIDYFLILWDIINWCKENNIQTGPGRGSAAGCLISYALGIVKIDPLRFDLIFERFLNESRIQSELPDIDIDFASDRRDDVIEYMKQRYGHDFVCRVGTYGTLQMRGVIKELSRAYGFEGEKFNMNFVTRLISEDNESWTPLFRDAVNEPLLKKFIIQNPKIVNDAQIALNSIKSSSMHACATIIVPKIKDENGEILNIYNQIPVRKDETGMLVSEWEGDIMADAGFLKEDILSTKQMAKIGKIFDLVKQRTGKQLDMEEIPLDDENVYNLFKQGLNQDVFHFGSTGLTTYLKQVKPENINELIASIALYRPGAMASNAHMDYVKLKKGELEPTYDFQLKGVTEDTYGLYIYQEQIMQAAQVLGDFTLAEADGVRKAMGKKIQEKMDGYKVQFVDKAVEKGCDRQEAERIWTKMEVFAGYGFNKSHAAAYSVIGYYCNWLKYYYPLEFWTVAFQFAKEEKIQDFVAEIKRLDQIEIVSPDINKSKLEFYSDQNTYKIYWNLSQIKYVGDAAADAIITERTNNGAFFSMEEFIDRIPSQAVNIRTIKYLVLAGCFDEMYNIKNPSSRLKIMKELYELKKTDLPQEYSDNVGIEHYWSIQQVEASKLSALDYHKLFQQTQFYPYISEYHTSEDCIENMLEGESKVVMVAGTLIDAQIRKTKKERREYAVIKIMQDQYPISIRVWPDQLNENIDGYLSERFKEIKPFVEENKKRLCIFRGIMKYNNFINGNEITLNDRVKGPIFEYFK